MAVGTSSGNRYTVSKTYSGATAFSAAAWIYYSTSTNGSIAGLWEDAGESWQWLLFKNSSNQAVVAIADAAGGAGVKAVTAGTFTQNTWQHIALTFSSSDLLRCFVNGAQVGTAAIGGGALKSVTASFGIGARQNGNEPFAGRIAELATWTVRLTASQIASLNKGFAPPKVLKPDAYIPLIRNVVDLTNKYTITTTGSPTIENHPRIYK